MALFSLGNKNRSLGVRSSEYGGYRQTENVENLVKNVTFMAVCAQTQHMASFSVNFFMCSLITQILHY